MSYFTYTKSINKYVTISISFRRESSINDDKTSTSKQKYDLLFLNFGK